MVNRWKKKSARRRLMLDRVSEPFNEQFPSVIQLCLTFKAGSHRQPQLCPVLGHFRGSISHFYFRDAFIKYVWWQIIISFLLLFRTFPFWDSLVSDPLNPICEKQTGEREAKIPKSQLSEAQNFVLLWENFVSDFIIRFVSIHYFLKG